MKTPLSEQEIVALARAEAESRNVDFGGKVSVKPFRLFGLIPIGTWRVTAEKIQDRVRMRATFVVHERTRRAKIRQVRYSRV